MQIDFQAGLDVDDIITCIDLLLEFGAEIDAQTKVVLF